MQRSWKAWLGECLYDNGYGEEKRILGASEVGLEDSSENTGDGEIESPGTYSGLS
jgi:hypothetical protein